MGRARKTSKDGAAPTPFSPDPRQVLELWIALGRLEWTSLVVVPADGDSSAAAIARALADMGHNLSFVPVTAITIDSLEYGSALALADLQQHIALNRREPAPAIDFRPPPVEPIAAPASSVLSGQPDQATQPAVPAQATQPGTTEPAIPVEPSAQTEALVIAPNARLIIAIPPVVDEPLGLPAAQAADAVILVARMGKSHVNTLRRSVQLIGRERVLGTVLLR